MRRTGNCAVVSTPREELMRFKKWFGLGPIQFAPGSVSDVGPGPSVVPRPPQIGNPGRKADLRDRLPAPDQGGMVARPGPWAPAIDRSPSKIRLYILFRQVGGPQLLSSGPPVQQHAWHAHGCLITLGEPRTVALASLALTP